MSDEAMRCLKILAGGFTVGSKVQAAGTYFYMTVKFFKGKKWE
jgi:hypothetical protein